MTRESLGMEGHRPFRVSVYVERGRVWCKWTVKGAPKFKSWRDTRKHRDAALVWARRYAATRLALEEEAPERPVKLTLRGLRDRYWKANRKDWRPKTLTGYEQYYAVLDDVIGGATPCNQISLNTVDEFKDTQREREEPIAHSQVRRQIGFLRQMFNWAEGRDLIGRNRLRAYRYTVPKDEREESPAEYRRADLVRIAAQLEAPRHWRARTVITLCGTLGARINAVLHLKWSDVDLDAGTVTWRAEWDKLGKEASQPLTPKARAALTEAHQHRHESEPWVFWAVRVKGRPYHYNSVVHHLWEAEKSAGVEHLPGRAFHGLRRMVVGDIGDLRDAAAWVRQASLKVTAGYDKQRSEQVERAAAKIAEKEASA